MRSKPRCAIGIASEISAGQARRGALAAGGFFFFFCFDLATNAVFFSNKKTQVRQAETGWLRLPYLRSHKTPAKP